MEQPWVSFLETANGVEVRVLCGGRLWTDGHQSYAEAVEAALNYGLLDEVKARYVSMRRLQFPFWSKPIGVDVPTLRQLGFRPSSYGTASPITEHA